MPEVAVAVKRGRITSSGCSIAQAVILDEQAEYQDKKQERKNI
jgi:hypothetical protein